MKLFIWSISEKWGYLKLEDAIFYSGIEPDFFANLILTEEKCRYNETKWVNNEIYILGNKGYANSGFVKYRPALLRDDFI